MKNKFIICSLIISTVTLITGVLINKGTCEEDKTNSKVIKVEKDISLLSGAIIKTGEEIIKVDSRNQEYEYISSKFGARDQDWGLVSEAPDGGEDNGKVLRIDIVKVEILKTKEIRTFYFDVSSFSNVLVE